MRKFLLIPLVCVSLAGCTSENSTTTVSTITETTHHEMETETQADETPLADDDEGSEQQTVSDLDSDSLTAQLDIAYSKELIYTKVSNGFVYSTTRFDYNSDGKVICKSNYSENGSLKSRIISEYDNRGNKIQMIMIDSNDLPTGGKWLYTYDDDRLEACTYYKDGGVLFSIDSYVYDETGSLIEEYTVINDKEPYLSNQYTNNDQGNPIKREYWSSGKSSEPTVTDYTYDDGRLISSLTDYAGSDIPNQRKDYVYREDDSYEVHVFSVDGSKEWQVVRHIYDSNDEMQVEELISKDMVTAIGKLSLVTE